MIKASISVYGDPMNPTPPKLDALVIAPHPDDAELGMGGTILQMLAAGKKIGVLDLTSGEPTPYGSVEKRLAETALSTEILGLTWRGNLGLPNRTLVPTLEARKDLASLLRLCQPAVLFSPFWQDAHPDHVAATQLIEDARFWAKLSKTDMPGTRFHPQRIYYYYCVHLKQVIDPAFVIDISAHFEQKMEAVRAFRSQFIEGRPITAPTFLDGVITKSEYWGQMIGVRYGEPFQSREPIGLTSMETLI